MLTIVWLVAINLIWLIPTVKDLRHSASVLALEIADRVKHDISLTIADVTDELNSAARQIGIEPERSGFILRDLMKRSDLFVSVAYVDRSGKEIERIDKFRLITKDDLLDHSKSSYFYLALSGSTGFSKIFLSSFLEPRIYIAVPEYNIRDPEHIIVAEVNLRNFIKLVSSLGREQGHIYVVDKKGFQFLHPDIGEALKRVNFLSRSIVEKVIVDGNIADGLSSEDSYVNESGEKVFAVGIPITEMGWGVFVEQPRGYALSGEKQVISFALITVILGAIIFLIIVKGNIRFSQLNDRLKILLGESEETAKILIRRDLELTKANEGLMGLDIVKSQFVSIAAHQLRTPLTGIKWSLHSLLEGDAGSLNENQKEMTVDATQATERLVKLINDLLDTSRLEEGRFEFKLTKQDMMPLIEMVVREHETITKEKKIDVSLIWPKIKLPLVNIDADKLKIALDNILDNAIKYTYKNGKINIKVAVYKKRIVVSIEDSGIGIPKEQQPRVFSKFFRGRNAQLMQTSGTGLGLSMSKEIIEKHEGSMGFFSEEGKGSMFYFTLPLEDMG